VNKKYIVFIALLIAGIICIPLAFWKLQLSPPQDKTVNIRVKCKETCALVPDGLNITLTAHIDGSMTKLLSGGVATFTNIPVGNYTVSYYWNQRYNHNITITCEKCCWNFTYYVPNPTILKWSRKAGCGMCKGAPPIVGLNYTLLENGVPIAWQLSNATGAVFFNGTYVDVCKNYTLQYTWQGITYTEPTPPIHFKYDRRGWLLVCMWEETNCLPVSKCGGDSG